MGISKMGRRHSCARGVGALSLIQNDAGQGDAGKDKCNSRNDPLCGRRQPHELSPTCDYGPQKHGSCEAVERADVPPKPHVRGPPKSTDQAQKQNPDARRGGDRRGQGDPRFQRTFGDGDVEFQLFPTLRAARRGQPAKIVRTLRARHISRPQVLHQKLIVRLLVDWMLYCCGMIIDRRL
jgi:hypothetical protein